MRPYVVSSFVEAALRDHRPVVALETTVVTHGLPYPQGVETAATLEADVVAAGAVPATIGVLDGAVHVGMTLDELHRLAADPHTIKLNPGNLAAQVASGHPGSTTVAATVLVAGALGIGVFATGGIGGVHRAVEHSDDVSADLYAIARSAVAVVCAGAKAVLDLPRTRERLESFGVPVYGFGTGEFPAFYSRSSGLAVDHRFDDVETLARAVATHFELSAGCGVLVGNPIPAEHELPRALSEPAIEAALAEAKAQGIAGRDVTPFLLDRLRVITDGRSLAANVALLRANAQLAARLARAIAEPAVAV